MVGGDLLKMNGVKERGRVEMGKKKAGVDRAKAGT